MNSKTHVFFITAKTHLHVGSGDSNFGIIDNLVQRDPVTELPCIHGSSIKGAIKEYCEEELKWPPNVASSVFGSDTLKRTDSSSKEFIKGTHGFFSAHLLLLPVRSTIKPFFRATCGKVIEAFLDHLKNFNTDNYSQIKEALDPLLKIEVKEGTAVIFENGDGLIEDMKAIYNSADVGKASMLLGADLALLTWKDFATLCNDENLPVIARNQLDNGESKNLWYEQIVPRESRFYTFIIGPENATEINQIALESNPLVQIGANATVGYGYCKFTKLN